MRHEHDFKPAACEFRRKAPARPFDHFRFIVDARHRELGIGEQKLSNRAVSHAHANVESAKRTIPCLRKGLHGEDDNFVHLTEKGAGSPEIVVVAELSGEASLTKLAAR